MIQRLRATSSARRSGVRLPLREGGWGSGRSPARLGVRASRRMTMGHKREEHVVGGSDGVGLAPAARGVGAIAVAEPGDHPRLVLGQPVPDGRAGARPTTASTYSANASAVARTGQRLVLERLAKSQ